MDGLKTALFLGALTGLAMAAGYLAGAQSGVLLALFISAAINFSAYWWSAKMVLMTYWASEAKKDKHPELFEAAQGLATAASLPMPRLYVMDIPSGNISPMKAARIFSL